LDRHVFNIGGPSLTVSAAITAGTTYLLVVRWDSRNTLDGTKYACLSIDDVHTCGMTTPPTPGAPPPTLYVGSNGATEAASGIIEGSALYRRPLFDGTNGIDVGNGDEINQIYNAGVGEDATRITGSWDVVFNLPTNSQTGALVTGTGEAWTHPHLSNLIPGNSNRGGFLLGATRRRQATRHKHP
jgi:hypothetical protein